jgi:hypothetical protein
MPVIGNIGLRRVCPMFASAKEAIWVLPGLCLFAVAWLGFNRPPTLRGSTTFALFYFGLSMYFALLVGIWGFVFVLLSKWGVARLFGIKIGAPEEVGGFILAIVATLIVVVASKFKTVKRLDAAARRFCLALAAIPRLADQLGMELSSRADFYLVSRQLKAQVSEQISSNIGQKALNFKNDGSLSSRFTRAVSLYWLFVRPHTNGAPLEFPTNSISRSAYTNIMQYERKIVSQADNHYASLWEIGVAYFTTAQPIRQLEESLRRATQETSYFVCSLIARYVLYQEKTPTQRARRLSALGFDSYDHIPAFGIDQWVISILATAAITLVIIFVTPRSTPITTGDAFLRAIIFAIQIGLSILAGTFVARRFLQRDDGTGKRAPPIFELTWAGLIVVTISAALKIGVPIILTFPLTDQPGFDQSLKDFIERRPSLLFPFISTLSIGLLCSYLITLESNRLVRTVVGGICNGVAFIITGYLASLLFSPRVLMDFGPNIQIARLKIMLTSGIIGIAVGAMVVAMFRRDKPTMRVDVSRETPSTDWDNEWDGTQPIGRWADKALGGYSRANVEELEGRYVCFRATFANPNVINAYIVTIRWDMKQSCLAFEEEARADSTYTQRGQICIPDGKPFINLVTMDRGDIRLITLARPDNQGVARGLVLTLSNPRGMHFTPASAPVVLRRLGEQIPQLGFVHPGTPDYDLYQEQLRQVLPNYGTFGQ